VLRTPHCTHLAPAPADRHDTLLPEIAGHHGARRWLLRRSALRAHESSIQTPIYQIPNAGRACGRVNGDTDVHVDSSMDRVKSAESRYELTRPMNTHPPY